MQHRADRTSKNIFAMSRNFETGSGSSPTWSRAEAQGLGLISVWGILGSSRVVRSSFLIDLIHIDCSEGGYEASLTARIRSGADYAILVFLLATKEASKYPSERSMRIGTIITDSAVGGL